MPGTSLLPRRLRGGLITALAAAALLCVLASTAQAAGQWAVGVGKYQGGRTCYAGEPGYDPMLTETTVMYWTDPQAGYPAIADKYWLQVHTGAIGFTCPYGLSDIGMEVILPDGTYPAIDLASADPNDRVRCFYIDAQGKEHEVTDNTWTAPWDASIKGNWCNSKQIPTAGQYGYSLGLRMLPQGSQFVLRMPIFSSKRLAGMGGEGHSTKIMAPIISGVNQFVAPYQWVTVFDRPTQIAYPTPSTDQITDTTARTSATVANWYRKGKVFVDLGTVKSGTYGVSAGPFAIEGKFPQYNVGQGWQQLIPGTDYLWRLRFVDENGVETIGDPQTFRTTGTAPVTPPATPPRTGDGGTGGAGGGVPADPVTPTIPSEGEKPGTGDGDGKGGGGSTPKPGTPGTAPSGGAAPGPAPVAGPTGAGRSALPPVFGFAPGAKLKGLAKGLPVNVMCTAACDATATLKIDAKTAKKLGLGAKARVVATGKGGAKKAGKLVLTLRASKAVTKKLAKARSVRMTLTVSIAGGTSGTNVVTLKR